MTHQNHSLPDDLASETSANDGLSSSILRGKWLPTSLLGVYFLSLWASPSLPIPNLSWPVALPLAVAAFVTQGSKLNLRASIVFWHVIGLGFVGALLSLLRAPNFDLALWNTVGLALNIVILILFMTTVATRHARRVLVVLLIANGALWTVEIQRLIGVYGTLAYSTFGETGSDKNSIGFFLALGAVALFYLCAFFQPRRPMRIWHLRLVQLAFALASLWFLFNMTLIYARTAIASSIFGLCAIVYMYYKQSRKQNRVPIRAVFFLAALVFLGVSQLPRITSISPRWSDMSEHIIESISSGKVDQLSSARTMLIQKGMAVIGDNPLLGLGVGGSRPAYANETSSFGIGLIHNSYLSEWADKGILGLVAYIIWLIWYFKIVRSMFWSLPNVDQLWLVLYVPLILMIGSLDYSGINVIFQAVLAGIYYERVIRAKSQIAVAN